MNTRIVTNRRPLDFLGVQSYGPAVLKVGFGSGEEPNSVYACNKFRVPLLGYFVTGATSEEGGTIQSFGPTLNPEYLEINLREAEELNTDRSPNDRIDIAITETGCDANCCRWGQNVPSFDESAQLNYYQRIFPIVAKFKLAAFFFWTLFRGQHEWESGVGNKNGKGILIGVIDATIDPNTGVITSHQLSPAAVHIKQTFDAISAFNARANARPVAA